MRLFEKPMSVDHILFAIKAATPKQVFQKISAALSPVAGLEPAALYEALTVQEIASASASGGGVAIPQARLSRLSRPVVAVATLAQPVDFDAADYQPVDLVAILLSPHKDGPRHLQRLARLSRLMRDEKLCAALRDAESADTMQALLNGPALYRRAA